LAVAVLPVALVLQVFFLQSLLLAAVMADKEPLGVTAVVAVVVGLLATLAAQQLAVKGITEEQVLLTVQT